MPSALGVVAIIAATATILAQEPPPGAAQSQVPALLALENVASAVEANDYPRFNNLLTEATAITSDPALAGVVRAYEDLKAVWQYSLTNPTGAFFDDESSNGLFSRLVARYTEYQRFIEQFAIHATGGRTLYPTAETRSFLTRVASARLVGGGAPIVRRPLPQPAPPSATLPAAADQNVATTAAVPAETCLIAATIQSIEPTAMGLVIRATAPISARIVDMSTVRESGFTSLSMVTIDIPRAALDGAPAHALWSSGPFAEMRATRYRQGDECGLRLRLTPGAAATWVVLPTQSGAMITSRELLASMQRSAEIERMRGPDSAAALTPAGAARVGGNYTVYQLDGSDRIAAYQIQAGLAERIPALGTIRGFAADVRPRSKLGGPYWGLGLSALRVGAVTADLAGGDLFIPIGGGNWSSSVLLNSLIIRGAGASLLFPHRVGLQFFGGRTALSTLVRVVADGIRPGLSEDRIAGAQGTWDPRRWLSVAGGWMDSDFKDGAKQENLFEMVELRRGYDRAVRLLAEQSRTNFEDQRDESGYAITLEPRISTQRVSLGGAARYISSGFHPPAGAGFFSTLRRSYDLSGSFRQNSRGSIDVSAGQTKTFSLFDPENVGTLSSSRGASVAYVLTKNLSAYVTYSETDVKSDPGALAPADSHTSRPGASVTLSFGPSSTSLRVFREDVTNRIDRRLDLHSPRVEVDQTYRWRDSIDFFDRLTYADSRRPDSSRVGGTYQALAGFRNARLHGVNLFGQAGYSATPAGVSQFRTREGFASLGISSSSRFAQGSLQLTYQRLEVADQPPRSAWLMSFNGGRLFEWGPRAPAPPFDSRAMRLVDTIPAEQILSLLRVAAFEDRNGDGRRSSEERGVPGVRFIVDDARFTTNDAGEGELSVTAGTHRVMLVPEGPVLDYFVAQVSREFTAAPPDPISIMFALRPAGRLSGRVVFQGELTDPTVLQDIRIVARSRELEREAATDGHGEFRFGVFPEGQYNVSIDRRTIAREVAIEGPSEVNVSIRPGQKESVTFTLRKATARERVGAAR